MIYLYNNLYNPFYSTPNLYLYLNKYDIYPDNKILYSDRKTIINFITSNSYKKFQYHD